MHNLHTPKVCTPKGLGSWATEEGAELWWREGLPEGLLQRPLMEPSPVLHVSAPWGGVVPRASSAGTASYAARTTVLLQGTRLLPWPCPWEAAVPKDCMPQPQRHSCVQISATTLRTQASFGVTGPPI